MRVLFSGVLGMLASWSLLGTLPSAIASGRRCALRSSQKHLSSSSAKPKASGSGQNETTSFVAASWYAGWRATDFPPEKVSWSKYTIVTYAFALTTPDSSVVSLQASDQNLLPQFVKVAHEHNVKASLTIGGWTGSQYFSPAVATAENRTAFAKAVLDLVQKYKLDAVDFDWEYPGKPGIGCNAMSPSDSANFLAFLRQLRDQPGGRNLIISAAVGITPFSGTDGNPMSDVSEFAKVLDYIAIMAYDIWGSWTKAGVGPNAPLNDSCTDQRQGSAMSALTSWTAARFPVKQVLLGVPAYGHGFRVNPTAALPSASGGLAAYPQFEASAPKGDRLDEISSGVDQCGNPPSSGYSGIFNFWGLIQEGFLTDAGTPADGIAHRFDGCSQTPYVYNKQTQVMVSYDDAQSFESKGKFITAQGLRGFAMWDASGDYKDILLDSIIKGAAGKPTYS